MVIAPFHYIRTGWQIRRQFSYFSVLVTFMQMCDAKIWNYSFCYFTYRICYEYNTILFNGFCNILCILTSYAPLHLMVQLIVRFFMNRRTSYVDLNLKHFREVLHFAGTILLYFIYVLLLLYLYVMLLCYLNCFFFGLGAPSGGNIS